MKPIENIQQENKHLVIMAGGIGSRFWPLSTPEKPKQFIDILGCGKTLLQQTAERFSRLVPTKNIWVVTSEKYRNIIYEQLPDVPRENILLEPCMRNTAPCIAYVGWKIKSVSPDAEIIVTPSDHLVKDTDTFVETLSTALAFIEKNNAIVTVGISPTSPHTEYGYIAADNSDTTVKRVLSFKEKPNLEKAKEYLAAGNYYWNSGMFLWKLPTLIESFQKHAPEIAEIFDTLSVHLGKPCEKEETSKGYESAPKISVDYAIMEKADNIFVIPADFGWSDLGSWGSLRENIPHDENDNSYVGDATFINSHNCIAYICKGHSAIIENEDNATVIDNGEILLIYDSEGNLKEKREIEEQQKKS